MNILIIGSGGREHALAWKAAQSNLANEVWVAPGNAGTALEPKVKNINIAADDIENLLQFAVQQKIDLTIVGPEIALAAGIVDTFTKNNLRCFGPTQKAAMLETSKAFCKDFLRMQKIPTANYAIFHDQNAALKYIQTQHFPLVIKADGLAAGKGVVIASSLSEAENAVKMMLEKPGHSIVIEEFLIGEELSYIVMVSGEQILPLATSQDHKRRDNGDCGPNTGGMGAYSPVPWVTQELEQQILAEIIAPTVAAMAKQGTPYTGFLYAGLMISPEGQPKVLEFNCRLGDPETQVILMRLQSDLINLCMAALDHRLDKIQTKWDTRVALTVVLAANGYPQNYEKGQIIAGLETPFDTDCKIFHAGTAMQDHHIVTQGGRVLAVTTLAADFQDAQIKAYHAINKISWPNYYYRTDIGNRVIKYSLKT